MATQNDNAQTTRKAASESVSFCNLPRNLPREYFLAADRGDVYIIKGHKNLIAFISLLLIQKQCIQKIIFLKKVCLGVGFSSQVSSSRESGKHASVSKYHANKKYANLWFILLQVSFKRTKIFVLFLATFHLKDLREK